MFLQYALLRFVQYYYQAFHQSIFSLKLKFPLTSKVKVRSFHVHASHAHDIEVECNDVPFGYRMVNQQSLLWMF